MKKTILKYALFLLPFMAALSIELFLLPIDAFTFKVYEALIVRTTFGILKGPFYPDRELKKIEVGDLGHHTIYEVKKDVEWITDRYGYRKKNSALTRYPIVIIGDSNIAGASLTQGDMLSEVLEGQLSVPVYPLAPASYRGFFRHWLIMNHLPDTVIFASIERNITELRMPQRKNTKPPSMLEAFYMGKVQLNPYLQKALTVMDRIGKENMLRFMRATIERGLSAKGSKVQDTEPFFFVQGKKGNDEVPPARLERAVEVIKTYRDIFNAMGIRFIFLPIPNKETIYYDYLGTRKPDFLQRLAARLKELNIETIDTQRAFEDAYRGRSVQLYHTDDSHWNRNGVDITAHLLKQTLSR